MPILRSRNPNDVPDYKVCRMFGSTGPVPFGTSGDNDYILASYWYADGAGDSCVAQMAYNIRADETATRRYHPTNGWQPWIKPGLIGQYGAFESGDKSIQPNTLTTIASTILEPGAYLLIGSVTYKINATGTRVISIYAGDSLLRTAEIQSNSEGWSSMQVIAHAGKSTVRNISLRVKHSRTSAITVSGALNTIRLSC